MADNFSNTQPIYLQIVQRICRQLIAQEYKPGEKLPSVRDMAVQYGVNPNTVQRVNMELERIGVIESKRGQGMFVTSDTGQLMELRERIKEEQLERFAAEMRDLGYADVEIVEHVGSYLKRSRPSAGGSEGGVQ
ncbi:GntR family transcriptional regulator [Paenibacillus sp. MMS18-CY102]|uniref:GntR family transcriptional regulator n=1 Tax=Paenibacillus sp. MMS18-CY102 TaxID=2682849 RepID=UPI001365DAC2|nr:GntR family transcriptional regulator [Paenibacillus sp. MMS18-CY102]MWC29465.1 GntR family transcriptional regulator [Paenibacillus sp. MMS18-CY102]